MATVALNKASLHRERNASPATGAFCPPSTSSAASSWPTSPPRGRRSPPARAGPTTSRVRTGENRPMLANEEIDLGGLVRLADIRLAEENRLGVRLPVLEEVAFAERGYGLLARPHWVDAVVAKLKRAAELRLRIEVQRERVRRLEFAVRRTTQRVNLFEKVLIPTAQRHIRRIEIALADAERAAVVRSKIAKAKHARRHPGEILA